VKPVIFGQLPSWDGSPPMRTHLATEGVGPSNINSINQPGGLTPAFGGAVMVQVVPVQEKEGKIVRAPIEFPCVLDTAVEISFS